MMFDDPIRATWNTIPVAEDVRILAVVSNAALDAVAVVIRVDGTMTTVDVNELKIEDHRLLPWDGS